MKNISNTIQVKPELAKLTNLDREYFINKHQIIKDAIRSHYILTQSVDTVPDKDLAILNDAYEKIFLILQKLHR